MEHEWENESSDDGKWRPRCTICGRFNKWENLSNTYTPEFEDGSGCYAEESIWVCKKCNTGFQPVAKGDK